MRSLARKAQGGRLPNGRRVFYGKTRRPEGPAPSYTDPWTGVPLASRKVIVETLPGGSKLTTYVDTLDDLARGLASPPPLSPPKKRAAVPAPPAPPKALEKGQSRFASYKMPGHEGGDGA